MEKIEGEILDNEELVDQNNNEVLDQEESLDVTNNKKDNTNNKKDNNVKSNNKEQTDKQKNTNTDENKKTQNDKQININTDENKKENPKENSSKKPEKKVEHKENVNEEEKKESNNSNNHNKSESDDKADILQNNENSLINTENSITKIINIIKNIPKKNKIIIGVSCLCAISVLIIFSTLFALINSGSNRIISGTYIKGVDVSNLTKEEALEKLNNIINIKTSNEFSLFYNDYSTAFIPEQAGITYDVNSCIDTAFERGRSNNILADNYEILFSSINKKDIIPTFSYNEDFVNNLISEMQNNLPNKLIEPGYYIEDDNLIITKGIDGNVINSDELKSAIITNLNDFCNDNKNIEIPVILTKAQDIDIDKIHTEVYREPKDAYYTTDPFCVYPHEVGIDFAISIAEAKELIKENNESYTIQLQFSMPNVTTNQIGSEAFPDLLAEYSTTYSSSNVNRSTNS